MRLRMERIVTCPYSPNDEPIPSTNFGATVFESIRQHSTAVAMVCNHHSVSPPQFIQFLAILIENLYR